MDIKELGKCLEAVALCDLTFTLFQRGS